MAGRDIIQLCLQCDISVFSEAALNLNGTLKGLSAYTSRKREIRGYKVVIIPSVTLLKGTLLI